VITGNWATSVAFGGVGSSSGERPEMAKTFRCSGPEVAKGGCEVRCRGEQGGEARRGKPDLGRQFGFYSRRHGRVVGGTGRVQPG